MRTDKQTNGVQQRAQKQTMFLLRQELPDRMYHKVGLYKWELSI